MGEEYVRMYNKLIEQGIDKHEAHEKAWKEFERQMEIKQFLCNMLTSLRYR